MTIVVYSQEHKQLAADSRVTKDTYVCNPTLKIFHSSDKKWVGGGAGEYSLLLKFKNFVQKQVEKLKEDVEDVCWYDSRKVKIEAGECFEGLLINTETNKIYNIETNGSILEGSGSQAVGVAEQQAAAALILGCDAIQACCVAIKLDSSCGFPVYSYDLETGEIQRHENVILPRFKVNRPKKPSKK